MKFLTYHHAHATAMHRAAALLRGALACCIVAGFARSADSEPPRPPDPPSNTVSGGDETVGTLPVIGGNTIQMPFARNWRGTEAAFYVEGNASDVAAVILAARGRGFVTVEVLDPTHQRVRLAFHGQVMAVLDRDLLSTLPIDVGVAVPGSFGSGRATIRFGQGPERSVRVRPGVLHLPVASDIDQGRLESSPLRLRMLGNGSVRSEHTIGATADVLILRQVD